MNEETPTPEPTTEQPAPETPASAAPPPDSFAAKLKAAREAAGLSKTKMAELAKVSALTISNWEKGRALGGSEPSPQKQGSVLRKLREFLTKPVAEGVPVPTGEQFASVDDLVANRPIMKTAATQEELAHDPYDPVADEDPRLHEVNLLENPATGEVKEVSKEEFFAAVKSGAPLPDIPVGNVHTTLEGVLLRRLADDDDREGHEVIDGRRWFTVGYVAPHPRAKVATNIAAPATSPAPQESPQEPDSEPVATETSPDEPEPAEAIPAGPKRGWSWWNQ